jgi:hypothetical protein
MPQVKLRQLGLLLPLLWAVPAVAQDDDDAPPPDTGSHRVVRHGAAETVDDNGHIAPSVAPKAAPPPKPAAAAAKPAAPPIGSEEGDDLLAPGPPKAAPAAKATPKAAPKPPLKGKAAKAAAAKAAKDAAKVAKDKKASAKVEHVEAPPPRVETPPASEDQDVPRAPSKVVHRSASPEPDDDLEPAPRPAQVRLPARKSTADVPRAKKAASTDSFSFDLLPEEKHASTEEQLRLESSVETRRSMLEWHQALGISTAALMVGTVILGQLSYSDKFGGNGNTGQFEIWHSGFEAATELAFLTAGALAIFAPVPYAKKSSGVDTVTVHKYSMLVATIGMVTEVPLGIITVSREGYADQATLALVHLVIGYVTAAALGTGATALFF